MHGIIVPFLCLTFATELIFGFGIAEMVSNYAKVASNKDKQPEVIRYVIWCR